jgi:pimeloyl-ACP methyl ester carboxylesterase
MLPEVTNPVKKLPSALLALVCLLVVRYPAPAQTPEIKVETGIMEGASYRIDMPDKWNGILLIYYHGYSEHPVTFAKDKPNEMGTGFASAGYAVAQSGYSETGFALEHAIPETEALRRYTIAHYGRPKETYVLGHSMGGQLTMITMESYPDRYDGALPLCGLLQPTTWPIGRGSAMRAAFDFYYPGLLPGPIDIPASAPLDDDTAARVLQALPSNPTGLAELMALGHFKTQRDLASGIVFGAYIERDFQQKLGASVMDNANFIYAGGPDDNALNDGVKRYKADDSTLAYLKTWYTPTGVLLKPMLAVHTTYDPIIPADSVRLYADQVQRAGSSANFVQQYVKADGHCHFSGAETAAALDELILWKHTGKRPDPGILPVPRK